MAFRNHAEASRGVFAPNRRRAAAGAFLYLAALTVAGASPAMAHPLAAGKTITGTSRNDVLHGTIGPDTINGKAGNDKLYGLAGNDRLSGGPGNDLIVGGPGADVISCGPGSDTVFADPSDTLGPDCETVHGAATRATAGHYAGTTAQGKLLGFDVAADGKTMTNIVLVADFRCTNLRGFNLDTTAGPVSVDPHQGTFSGTLAATPLIAGGNVSGSFDEAHAASGSFQIDFVDPVDAGGVCSTGPISWTAQPTTSILLPGHYIGGTGFSGTSFISFDVLPDGRTVSNLKVGSTFTCQPSLAFTGSIGPTNAFAPVSDRALVYSGGVSKPTSGYPYTISLSLSFDAAGYFRGTTDLHVTVTDHGGPFECDTGQLNWQGAPQPLSASRLP